jgi:hypothetical protein
VPETNTEFARLLRVLRLHAGHPSDREIADRSGLSHTIVGNAHRGVQLPSWESAVRIITALGGDPGDLRPGWEIASSGVPPSPPEQVLGALRELNLRAKLDGQRTGALLGRLAPDMLVAGMIPGLPPLGEYVTGIDFGRVTVWHDVDGCQASAPFRDGQEFISWTVLHHLEGHGDAP